jgi:hypothetical protein
MLVLVPRLGGCARIEHEHEHGNENDLKGAAQIRSIALRLGKRRSIQPWCGVQGPEFRLFWQPPFNIISMLGIAGTVAAITESEPGVESERASQNTLVLTGTAPRGGQGVWLFSLT